MRRVMVVIVATMISLVALATTAFAYTDYVPYMSKQTTGTASTEGAYALGCMWCHGWEEQAVANSTNRVNVQRVVTAPTGTLKSSGPVWTNMYQQYGQPYGPHGGYTNTTDRCKVCHDMHAANGDKRLLPADTVADLCETCHDFTQGISVYGALRAETGEAPMGGHFVAGLDSSEQSTDTGQYIPGGALGVGDSVYPHTGGTTLYSAASLASQEAAMTCTDCHTPHGNTSMRPFKGDRVRLGTSIVVAAANIQPANITELQFGALGFPAGTNITEGLWLSPNSPVYGAGADGKTATELTPAGTALALSLVGAGVLDVDLESTTTPGVPYGLLLRNARLTRVASNKLLRDFVNNVDLRDPAFGGVVATNSDGFDETMAQWDPVLGGDNEGAANAPWNNGQGGAQATYGSGFCYACHQGRIGNYVGGVMLDADFSTLGTATALNHATDMKTAYSNVGNLLGTGYAAGGYGLTNEARTGLALSNAGFVMSPVATGTVHPDGAITRMAAPICQQCHEDSRDVESAWNFSDTDKSAPFSDTVNGVLGITGGDFIYAGNPQFQNFPHETQNGRLLVEGGDSSQPGGGENDDLCLNCHVPSSTERYDWNTQSKDLNGYME